MAEQAGARVIFAKTIEAVIEAVIEAAKKEKPSLIIADLHSQRCDPISLAQRVKSDEELRLVPLFGFFSHVETELKNQAEQAGFDHVLPRSAFAKNLSKILLRSGGQ